MFDQDSIYNSPTHLQNAHMPASSDVDPASLQIPRERLPFTIRVVHTQADLCKAVEIRHAAYARHVPLFAKTLAMPESNDAENGFVVLLAESKVDGAPLGTMRIQTNRFKPLNLLNFQTIWPAGHWQRPRAWASRRRESAVW